MIFGKRLRDARMMRDMTQQALADAVGVALRTYQCYEQGTRQPSLSLVNAFCDTLGVSADYLLGRDEIPSRKTDGQPT